MKKAVVSAVVVIVLVLVGAWYFTEPKTEAPVVANTQASQPAKPADTTSQPSAPAVTAQNSSDAAIGQDMASVDASMKALDADSASADSGINDKPVSQQ